MEAKVRMDQLRGASGRCGNAALVLMLAVVVACSAGDSGTQEVAATRQAVVAAVPQEQVRLAFTLPERAILRQVIVGAEVAASVGDRSRLAGDVAVATGDAAIGSGARIINLVASGVATVRDAAVVSGTVRARQVQRSPSASIAAITLVPKPEPPVTIGWTVSFASSPLGNVVLEPNQRRDLVPGNYQSLAVKSGSTATVHSGVYAFNDFVLEPNARLIVDHSHGPVQLIVRGDLTYRGRVEAADRGVPQLLVAVLGSRVFIESPFQGVLVAPEADVRLQAARPEGHRAAFFGGKVTLEPDTLVNSLPFDWSTVVGANFDPIPPNATVRELDQKDLGLTVDVTGDGAGNRAASGSSPTVETFKLRDQYTVAGGVIGNGVVTFRFRRGTGAWTTCTYVGQSATALPNSAEELIKGTLLLFQSCSDGLPPGAPRIGNRFDLTVAPSPGYPVTVSSPMLRPSACDDNMEMLTPNRTREMRDQFSWSAAQKVAGENPDGTPTLYYGWIYIRTKEDALALKKLYIHVLPRPLFDEELLSYAGRCGTFTNPGDGRGAFVPVVIPGRTYNRLIDALTSDEVQGDRVIFDAVILRNDVPLAARNPNGSISLQRLGESGFRYLGYETNAFADPSTMTFDGSAVSRALVGALEWVGQAARDVGEIVTGVLNEIDQLFRGEINVTFHVRATTLDSLFGGQPMVRAWGAFAGSNLGAPGMQVKVLQRLFDTPIPTTAQDDTNMNGVANIDLTRGAKSRGSGLCIEMRTDAATVTDFLLSTELCDLRGFIADDGNPSTDETQYAFQFDESKTFDLHVNNTRLTGLYQADDVYQYAKSVMGFNAPRARILSGYWASTFTTTTPTGKRLFTPCLNFPNSLTGAMFAAGTGAGVLAGGAVGSVIPVVGSAAGAAVGGIAAGTFAAVVGNTDIVMPLQSKVPTSRGVMSHEYGHYMLCSMAYEVNADAVDHIIWGTMIRGQQVNFPLRYTNEAIADFFMGQVTSGADYQWMTSGLPDTVGDQFCTNLTGVCWDTNASSQSSGNANIARVATMLHDAFDGHRAARKANVPQDGDAWEQKTPASPLAYSEVAYGDNEGGLERVHLAGSAMRTIVAGIVNQMEPFIEYNLTDGRFEAAGYAVDDPKVWRAVNSAMVAADNSWCDRCRVFALHEPGADISSTRGMWQSCMSDPDLVRALVNAPPDPALRLDASTCTVCPAGTSSDADGRCSVCAGEVVNNVCQKCQADVVLDGATMSWNNSFDLTRVTLGDNCPGTFWVEVRNPGAVFAAGADHLTATLGDAPNNRENCERPWSLLTGFPNPVTGYFTESQVASTGVWPDCTGPGICLEMCFGLPVRDVSRAEAAASVIRFGSKAVPNAVLNVNASRNVPPPG